MTAIDYAALIERLRKDWDDGSTESLLDAIAAIDRLISEDSAELAMAHKTIALQGDDIARIIAERDTLQEQVKTLRDALKAAKANAGNPESVYLITKESLAATEQKETP